MDLVQLMGGQVYLDLNVSVTHLIAGEVGSKKYLVAASLAKPILLPTWVKACWEKSQDRYVLLSILTFLFPHLLSKYIKQIFVNLSKKKKRRFSSQCNQNKCNQMIQ